MFSIGIRIRRGNAKTLDAHSRCDTDTWSGVQRSKRWGTKS